MRGIVLTIIFLSCIPALTYAQPAALDTGTVLDISDLPFNQDNPAVAISRGNKNTIVIGAATDDMDSLGMPAYVSTDRGISWQTSRLPLPLNPDYYIYGEPNIAADDAGNFYYAYITDDGSVIPDSAGNISIAISTDGGGVWRNAMPININILHYGAPDGPCITVDNSPSSPHHGRVYVVWDEFFAAPDTDYTDGGLYIAWSDDHCKTWSSGTLLGGTDDYQEVKTGKNGEIYVSSSDSLGIGHELFVSTDGGTTFGSPAESIAPFSSYSQFVTGFDSGFTGLKGAAGFLAFPYISFDVDLASNRIHLVYGDYQADVATLYYLYSDNNGATWSPEEGIQETSSSDRFDPSVSVDQKTHEVYVTFYSSDFDTKNDSVAPYRMRVRDTAIQMLDAGFSPYSVEATDSTAPYIGDHTSSDAFDSVYVGVWTQNRAGYNDGDVFAFISTAKAAVQQGVEAPFVIHSSNAWLSAPYPNPANGNSISLRYYIPHASEINFDLFDVTGRMVKHFTSLSSDEGSNSVEFDISNISSGTYLIRMTSNGSFMSQKFVIQ